MRRSALLAGHLAGVIVMGFVQSVFYLGCALLFGVEIASGVAGAIVILVLATLIAAGFGMLGAFMALRTGSGEAIQALFPVLFIFLFMSSMNAPRNLMEVDWFRTIATLNPVSYLIEAVRSLIITGWNLKALSLGFSVAIALIVISTVVASHALRQGWPAREPRHLARVPLVALGGLADDAQRADDAEHPHSVHRVSALLLHGVRGRPSQLSGLPGFDFPAGYTAFQFVFVLLQSAAFGGVFTGFGIARDFEYGFAAADARRAAPQRDHRRLRDGGARAVGGDRLCAGSGRLALGMDVLGSGVDIVGLFTLALLLNICALCGRPVSRHGSGRSRPGR